MLYARTTRTVGYKDPEDAINKQTNFTDILGPPTRGRDKERNTLESKYYGRSGS